MKFDKKIGFDPGYLIGGTIVLIILPSIFYFLSQKLDFYINTVLIENSFFQNVLTSVLFIIGFYFAISSLIIQRKIGQGGPAEGYKIKISPKTKNLVITGPYRYTRNPMLFGTFTIYCSFAVFFNSIGYLLITILFAIVMLIFVKLTEEKRLLKDFGKEYEIYKNKTSIFIPWLSN